MLKKLKALTDNKIWSRTVNILFPVILVLYSLMNIGKGVTVTDTGYNYGNFVFFDKLDDMWKFSTYLSGALGALFTHLPLGQTMIGLNFYTGLIKVIAALIAYYFCIRVCKMRKESVFLGEMLALGFCWCPTALIYNYMTYLFFLLGVVFIFCAFKTEKSRYLLFAGMCLGINLMVRLPNLAEIALIFCVWFGGIIYKKGFEKIVKDTLICILGYVVGVGSILLYIVARYGLDAYISGIRELFAMTENATSYSALSMVTDSFKMYMNYSKWFVCLWAIIICGMMGFLIWKNKFLLLKKAGVILVVVMYVWFAYNRKQFTVDYRNYSSMFFWGVLFLMVSLVVCAYTMLFSRCKNEMKLLSALSIFIILITPIGSNNGLYSPINNLFIVAPVVFSIIGHLLYAEKRVMIKSKLEVNIFPIKALLIGFVAVVFVQSVLFGANFVFRDGLEGQKRAYMVKQNEVLNGMKTTEKNASNLQGLNDYLADRNKADEKVLLFGSVPAIAFYFSMEPVISTTWPDLESFSADKFDEEINDISIQELPIVIVDTATETNLQLYTQTEVGNSNWEKKIITLSNFIEENDYDIVYSNDAFVVYDKAR